MNPAVKLSLKLHTFTVLRHCFTASACSAASFCLARRVCFLSKRWMAVLVNGAPRYQPHRLRVSRKKKAWKEWSIRANVAVQYRLSAVGAVDNVAFWLHVELGGSLQGTRLSFPVLRDGIESRSHVNASNLLHRRPSDTTLLGFHE